jgi:hypothetical protein
MLDNDNTSVRVAVRVRPQTSKERAARVSGAVSVRPFQALLSRAHSSGSGAAGRRSVPAWHRRVCLRYSLRGKQWAECLLLEHAYIRIRSMIRLHASRRRGKQWWATDLSPLTICTTRSSGPRLPANGVCVACRTPEASL